MTKILVTSALPYANGPIHFGHIAGAYLPADVFVRHHRMLGDDVVYICGTDEHGVAITIGAEQQGTTPAEHVAKYRVIIKDLFDKLHIEFDNFSRTTLPLHHDLARRFFEELKSNGHLFEQTEEQYFCDTCNRFLADRYLTGSCPHCGHPGARGDECTGCGKWLESVELTSPACKLCGGTPAKRSTKHWYFRLDAFSDKLRDWLQGQSDWKEHVRGYVLSMLDNGLKARPISRDLHWGVPVPGEAEGKVLYVWFDAPIGYISSTMEWAEKQGKPERWRDYWQDPACRIYHFIGKDNIPFHCAFWPAMLMGQSTPYTLPCNVPANEWLTLEGRQFSKSDGWYIDLTSFFERYSADSIRYCLAANAPESSDTEFSWKDFQLRNNSELANIYGNLVNRVLRFVVTHFDGRIPEAASLGPRDREVLAQVRELFEQTGRHYSAFELRRAAFAVMELGRVGNRYVDELAPWDTVKNDPPTCATTLNVSATILLYLACASWPLIPSAASKLLGFLGLGGEAWEGMHHRVHELQLAGRTLGPTEILFHKIEDDQIAMEIEALHLRRDALPLPAPTPSQTSSNAESPMEPTPVVQPPLPAQEASPPTSESLFPPLKEPISYEDFARLDLRAATVIAAERVPKTDRLLHLEVELGLERRHVVAGVAGTYAPEDLLGKRVILLANLEPRKLRGVVSHGMLLAAGEGDRIRLLTPDGEVANGTMVK
ncbi:MAG: hypothetical protein A2284_06680 [Deltaproteobacteria bacterium RIFOXYA12_FULL_61_11]|nr:MAG: hypothetical protein A2284_06680 [Deltaproteobacteria bacterium RIFOXYA12_FULL_61_11]